MVRKFRHATQIKVDVFYDEISEVYSLINAIHSLNNNHEFDLEIPAQDMYSTEDVTSYYKEIGELKKNVEFDETALPYQDFDMVQPGTDSIKLYLLIVEGDVVPGLHGPFNTEEERDDYARDWRERFGDHDGIYPMSTSSEDPPKIGAYSGGFFEDEEDTD